MADAPARRALLSVSDKTGIVAFGRRLAALGFELVSTGGTCAALREAGLDVTYVSDITGFPELWGGRVKTLHPMVHGGILYRRDLGQHAAEAAAHGVVPIDVIAVNLYPFVRTVADPNVSEHDAIEQIDIGGPAMVRAAAKNFEGVAVVVDPADYDDVARAFEEGSPCRDHRRALALKAFRHTATYDSAIATWLGGVSGDDAVLPPQLHEPLIRASELRYGENPHQAAALYHAAGQEPLHGADVLQGKALSYNNLVDLDAAVAAVLEYDEPAAVVVKHTNPCGVGRSSRSLLRAWERALAGDPVSAFGGIVAVNREVDGALAEQLADRFLEVVAAPSFSTDAAAALGAKKNLRLVAWGDARLDTARAVRRTLFGTLVQGADPRIDAIDETWNVVTERAPSDDETTALRFLWRVCKHVKSNAIVVGDASRTFGVGAGQMSRVDAVELAVKKSTGPLAGAALASDAFFPFRDGLDAAAQAGITAVIQPGGSRRDDEVVAAANEHGIAMVFTGHRHFRH